MWRSAHPIIHDESRWLDMDRLAFEDWLDLGRAPYSCGGGSGWVGVNALPVIREQPERLYRYACCTQREALAHQLHLRNLTYPEIGEELACAPRTAQSLVRKAALKLDQLREDLAA